MKPSEPDRTLRRLVVRLAELNDADRQAILRALSREQAEEVARLIGAYRGGSVAPVSAATDGPWAGLGLSPGLRQALDGEISDLRMPANAGDGADRRGVPTTLTLETLRRLARDLEPALPEPPTAPAQARPGSWARLGLQRGRP